MALGDIHETVSQMSALSPEAQARVHDSLKATIANEVGAQATLPGTAAAAFSRGIFFSKSGKDTSLEEIVLPAVTQMNEAQFQAFAQRLSTLKQSAKGSAAP